MSGNASLEEDDVYSDAISTEQTNENVPLIMAEETNKTEQEVGIEGSPLTQAAATIGNPEAQNVGTEMSPGSKEAGTADSPRIPTTETHGGSLHAVGTGSKLLTSNCSSLNTQCVVSYDTNACPCPLVTEQQSKDDDDLYNFLAKSIAEMGSNKPENYNKTLHHKVDSADKDSVYYVMNYSSNSDSLGRNSDLSSNNRVLNNGQTNQSDSESGPIYEVIDSKPKPCGSANDEEHFEYDLAVAVHDDPPPPLPLANHHSLGLSASLEMLADNIGVGDGSGVGDSEQKENGAAHDLEFSGASGRYEPIGLPETAHKITESPPVKLIDPIAVLMAKGSKSKACQEKGDRKSGNQRTNKSLIRKWRGQHTCSKTDTMLTNVYDPKDDPENNSFGDDAISYGYDSDSSEFDSFSDQEMTEKDEYSEKPLPPVPKKKKKAFKIPKVIKGRFKSKSLGEKGTVLPVSINLKKHPPPELPPTPDNLTQQQIKKRHVIESIISSEKSYIESLQRILKVYEKELLYTYGLDTKDSSVKFVFLKIREILNYHLMFQIELADRVKKYDQEEKIGSIFINSFSRAMVSEVYSDYVNKFSIAMEEIKRAQNANPALKKFLLDQVGVYPAPKVSDSEPVSKEIQVLKECGQESHDRLSIFGLMVKPIQRFPQFIMLLKDLIKYTPTNHHDRGALQGAITDLENVAHRLNESKRECEQQLEAKKLTKRISKNLPDKASRLLREDEFEHLEKNGSDIRVKKRQVFLLDDCLIVATTSNSSMEEKRGQEPLRLKIYCSLKDLELKDSAISPDMHSSVNLMPTHMSITSRIKVPPNEDLYHLYSDMNDMMHDLPVLGKISSLINSLRKSYSGLSEDLIHETVRDLQHMIQIKDQQLQLLNSCCINLHNIVKNERYTFQTATPELKQRWCKDFQMAKYALEPQNNPSWLRAEESCSIQPAVFMKWFSVDMPRNFTSMKCAVPVYLTSAGSQDIGIQHLWIVMTKEHRTYISLVSTQSVRPQLVESFQAISEEVVAVETIPGFATVEKENAFMEDTVWMSTTSSKIFVYSLTNEQDKKMARKPVAEFYCHGVAMVIHDAIDRVFVGLANGNLAIYDRNEEGEWNFCSPHTVVLDTVPVRCIVSLEEQVWVSCRDAIYIFNYEENKPTETVDLKMKNESCSREINCIVHTGVGLWLSFKDESTIYMLHAEFKDIQQECNITKAVERVLQDMDWNHSKAELCTVTSLMASRGFLWVGTSVGIVLLYSLPRLKDGVPRIWGKPWVSCHSHNGPIKFLLPIYCDTVNVWRSFSQTDIISIPSPSKEAKKEKTSEQKETNGENDSENPDLVNNVPNEAGLSVSSPSSPTGTEEKDLNTDADSKVSLRKGSRSLLSENENLTGTEDEIKSSKAVDPENNNMHDSFAKVLPVDKNDMITSPERSMSLSQSKPDQYPPINLSRKSYGNEKLHAELSNRLGLQNKGLRRSLPNLLDIDKEEDEITLYYDELMTYKDGPEALKVDSLESKTETFQSVKVANEFRSKMSETLQNTPSVPKEKDKNSIFSRTNPVMHSYSVKSETKRTAIKPSLSLKSPLKDVQKMKALDTMGKRTCNAVIVVSGGDGYFDWRKINERNVIRNDEASLMMWMYKF